jgi:triacylglycerol lipase
MAFAWRSEPDFLPTPEAGATGATTGATGATGAPSPRGVVLVHGYLCNRGLWLPILRQLRAQGTPYVAVNLEPAFGSIDEYAKVLDAAVSRITEVTGQPPLIVGHSMGGLATRAWLRTTTTDRFAHAITLGTPHHGTWLGKIAHTPNGKEMNIGSAWLRELHASEAIRTASGDAWAVKFTCVVTPADNIVFPAATATLENAHNVFLEPVAHVAMVYEPRVMALIGQHLGR